MIDLASYCMVRKKWEVFWEVLYSTVVLAASKLRQKWVKMGWSADLYCYMYLLFVRASVGQKI